MRSKLVFLFPFLVGFGGCASSLQPVPEAWMSVPQAPVIAAEQLRRTVADVTPVARPAAPPERNAEHVRIVTSSDGARLYRHDKPLTPPYRAIGSFDVSLDRGEVVFSAKRDTSFDIGLVALEGSQVNWVPEDLADEVEPRWAPRGNKASYVVRGRGGDLVRTVHIPTAVQLVVDFPFGRVRDLAWDAPAERFAVAWETVDASQRVEVMRYGGEERRIAIPPAVQLDVTVAPFAGGLLMRPSAVRYNERLPLVIWLSSELTAWDDARAAIVQGSRAGVLVLDSPPDQAVLEAIQEAPWIDRAAMFLVDPAGISPPLPGVMTIAAGTAIPSGRYRRTGTAISVDPAVVKSFAARFIEGQLKETSPSGQ